MRIALCGEARSGKDTVARNFGGFISLAFGDYMKDAYYKERPWMKEKPKDREDMIDFSQPLVEEDNLIWVRQLDEELNSYIWKYGSSIDVVITDLRQPHEEQWCKDNGFHIVRVVSNSSKRYDRMEKLGEKPMRDLPYWVTSDFYIYNDGTLEDLKRNCKKLLTILEASDKIKTVTNEVNKSLERK